MSQTPAEKEKRKFPRIPKQVPINVKKLAYPLPEGPGERGAGKNVQPPRHRSGRGGTEVRVSPGRPAIRRSSAWRNRLWTRPPGHADDRRGLHPRRDRLSKNAKSHLPDDPGSLRYRPQAVKRTQIEIRFVLEPFVSSL